MATKTANIEAVGAGQTSATFTTTKEGLEDVSLDIKIRVKAATGKVDEWLMLPLINYFGINGSSDYGFKYPVSVFKGDKIIIEQGVADFNRAYAEKNVTFLSTTNMPFSNDELIIKNKNGDRIGKFERINGYVDDRSDAYNDHLLEFIGENWNTNTNLWFGKREFWIVFDDVIMPNEQITFTLSSLWTSASRWYRPQIYLDYHGDMTRDEAITAGIKILDGNTDPNV